MLRRGRDVYWAAQTCALSCPLSRPQSDETAPGKEGGALLGHDTPMCL
jgi:hypothetical protein